MHTLPPISVIGYGSWGTALVQTFLLQGYTVHWYVRDEGLQQQILQLRHNPRYLPQAELPLQHLVLHSQPEPAIAAGQLVLLVTPSAYLHSTLLPIGRELWQGKAVASGIKGLVPESSQLVTDYMHQQHGVPVSHLAVISGPAHSEEVAVGKHTWLTVAAGTEQQAALWSSALQLPHLHARPSNDLIGIQWGGILKNVFAIAAGMALGLGHGDNMIASLVGSALYELEDLMAIHAPLEGRRMGAPHFLGDLLATCYSPYSRNRQLGQLLGQGYTPETARAKMGMVAEGYFACRVLTDHYDVRTPIVQMVANVLYHGAAPQAAFHQLLQSL